MDHVDYCKVFRIWFILGFQFSQIFGQGLQILTPAPPTVLNCPQAPQCTLITNCADPPGNLVPRLINNPNFTPFCGGPPFRDCCTLISPNPITTTTLTPIGITPACGTQTLLPFPGYVPGPGQASYNQYNWMVVILGTDNSYVGGGVLLDANTVLTTAHRIFGLTIGLKVRLGELLLNANTEPFPVIELLVTAIRINTAYNNFTLQNDIAILKLASSVNLAANPQVGTICLPTAGTSFTGQTCWVSGFGASSPGLNGVISNTLNQVSLPVVSGPACNTALQSTRLGPTFNLDQISFMCAGGFVGQDACNGDGGSPLVCNSNGIWSLAGLVSWGIGCGLPNVPGVYVNVPNYIGWIASNRF